MASREWPRESQVEYGVIVPNVGDNIEARMLVTLARDGEGAEWDGFFLWDHTIA